MTNLTELTVRAAALQSELAEVQRQIDAAKVADRWALANMGGIVQADGGGGWVFRGDDRSIEYQYGFLTFNPTRAREYNRFRRAHWKLRTLTGDFVPDWNDGDQEKWYHAYSHYNKYWTVCCRLGTFWPGAVCFPSKEAAIAAREAMGDQMDDLLFDFNRP